MSVLARTTGGSKARSVAIDLRTLAAVGGIALAASVGWGVGAHSGYSYAQEDAAAIMRLSGGDTYQRPSWRGWMVSPYDYDPPSDLDMLMNFAGGTIPGTGGMTTGDVWSGYQDRIRREFFNSDK